jgi:hypothetical protein
LDSREVEAQKITTLAERARRSLSLQRMLGYMVEFRSDPEKKLAPLYDIIKIVETEFGDRKKAATALGIPFDDLHRAGGILHDPAILTSRHRGESTDPQRAATDEELAHCIGVAETIIRTYAEKLAKPKFP